MTQRSFHGLALANPIHLSINQSWITQSRDPASNPREDRFAGGFYIGCWPENRRQGTCARVSVDRRKGYRTVYRNNQEYRLVYLATRSSVHLFVRTAHSFTCSALIALLAGSAVLTSWLTSLTSHTPSLAHFANSLARGKVNF